MVNARFGDTYLFIIVVICLCHDYFLHTLQYNGSA